MNRVRRTTAVIVVALASVSLPQPAQAAIATTPVATGLAFPAAFTVFPDAKRFLYGEQPSGEIRIYNDQRDTDVLFFDVPDVSTAGGEHGLLGLALHPNYPTTRFVYAYVTRKVGTNPTENQILRFTESGGKGTNMQVIFSSPAGGFHMGGRILFGPDGNLYALIGDRGVPSTSQDLTGTSGKVVRMTPSGGIPSNNPFSGRYAFAYGVRNGFGMAFDPQTGRLWKTDNGPDCNDELNRVDRGRNYGWGPSFTCT
ncbi:MAG: PQQ-dependent sugar dehydrogenase, partial [Actinomycetota bacterium]|nr:PQQ-dependent sugar dehydrogenase [Actinomycetota bacterium]